VVTDVVTEGPADLGLVEVVTDVVTDVVTEGPADLGLVEVGLLAKHLHELGLLDIEELP
jgi:hypothetical protein